MRYRPLGSSGLQVSVVGLGCNNFGRRLDANGTRAVVEAAIDAGITLFDTADIYGGAGASETLLGEVLGARRDKIVLATKFGHGKTDMGDGPAAGAKGGRAYIKRAVTESLRRLRTDYLGCSSVIAGAMSPEQVKANAVAGHWVPTAGQLAELDAIVAPPE
jgi:aryl-alcohol dehydrogenase-like predicted oxidoreductase